MRFVNNFKSSLILAQPQNCSSNHLGAMASQRDKGHFEMAKLRKSRSRFGNKSHCGAWKNHYASMPRCMAAVVEANGDHTKYKSI